MLEKGFRGTHLSRDQLILSWNGKTVAEAQYLSGLGLTRPLRRTLYEAVAATAPAAALHHHRWRLAAKTGTTDGGRDAWFVGFVLPVQQTRQMKLYPRITFVAWAGFNDNRPAGLYGGKVHGPIFGQFLRDVHVQQILTTLLEQ